MDNEKTFTLPPIGTWPIYTKLDIVRAYQTLVELVVEIPVQPFKQTALPGDYIVVGFSNVMRVVPKEQFERMYQKGDEPSAEKALLLAR